MLKTLKFKSQFTHGVRGRKHFSEPRFLLGSIPRQCFLSLVIAQTRAIFIAEDSKHLIPPLSQSAWGRLLTTTCLDWKRPQELFIINELFIAAPIQSGFFFFFLLDLFFFPHPTTCVLLILCGLKTSHCCLPTLSTAKAKPKANFSKVRENVELLLCGLITHEP